ncbi:MAG: GNAT family N-acetyltransferase [Hydrogenophaga sp.]|nr:GNAT family N-acetyltransferase [Hydrogenophaga sp.]
MNEPTSTAGSLATTDLFQTEAWFNHLLAHGFVDRPTSVLLRSSTSAREVVFPLMRTVDGRSLQSLSNYYSCLFGPQGGVQTLHADDWRAVASSLRGLAGSAVVQLQPLDPSSEWMTAFEAALHATGYWTDRFFCFGNWYQPVPLDGFDAYWAERPSPLRHSVERGRRRLDKAGTWHIEINTSEADDLNAAIEAYETVYAQSWKQPEPCPGFMPGLIRTAAREGWLRLGVLRLNGQALAAQLWLVHGGKANIYKLAYVKGFEKLSAGSVLTSALMQHVMDIDRVEEVDYLIGDDAYKADWMALRRERVGLLACDMRRWCGWLAAGRHVLGRWRRSVKSILTTL